MGFSSGFFKNYRVYILTSVAYIGSFLFGMYCSIVPTDAQGLDGCSWIASRL